MIINEFKALIILHDVPSLFPFQLFNPLVLWQCPPWRGAGSLIASFLLALFYYSLDWPPVYTLVLCSLHIITLLLLPNIQRDGMINNKVSYIKAEDDISEVRSNMMKSPDRALNVLRNDICKRRWRNVNSADTAQILVGPHFGTTWSLYSETNKSKNYCRFLLQDMCMCGQNPIDEISKLTFFKNKIVFKKICFKKNNEE